MKGKMNNGYDGWSDGRQESRRRWKSGLRQLSSGEQERRMGLLLSALNHLDGGDRRRRGDDEALESLRCLWRDRPSWPSPDGPPEELRVREHPSAHFEPPLCWVHDVSRSSEGPNCHSTLEPMFRGTDGPTVGWGRAAPNMSFILARNASCHSSTSACTSGGSAVVDVDGAGESRRTWGAMEDDGWKTWVVDEESLGGWRFKAKSGCCWVVTPSDVCGDGRRGPRKHALGWVWSYRCPWRVSWLVQSPCEGLEELCRPQSRHSVDPSWNTRKKIGVQRSDDVQISERNPWKSQFFYKETRQTWLEVTPPYRRDRDQKSSLPVEKMKLWWRATEDQYKRPRKLTR